MNQSQKGYAFAQKHAAQFGVEQAERTMESIFAANKGRPADDPYVRGVRAGLAAVKATCPGCGVQFKSERGKKVHQGYKFVAMSCRPKEG